MAEDIELLKVLEAHKGELKTIADAAGSGNKEKVIDAASALALSVASGSPLIGALAPLGRKAIARAFGNSVNAALTRELELIKKDDERKQFLGQMDELVEVLLGQAVIQLIRSQHAIKGQILEALGGMRRDFEAFRNDFAARVASASDDVRVDTMLVRDGALGFRVCASSVKRVRLTHVEVVGSGSVGFVLE